jgi:nitrogen regulatory protein P-II 1
MIYCALIPGPATGNHRFAVWSHAMKMIVAIIRPENLEEVQQVLAQDDVYLMTVSDVRGFGKQRGFTEVYRGQEVVERMVPKLKLEIAVNDAFVEATVDAIVRAARTGETGNVGDGKIFVLPLDQCIRIRTGETGPEAIGP